MTMNRRGTRSSLKHASKISKSKRAPRAAAPDPSFTDLVCRLRHEMLETSTPAFTPHQAADLWGLDHVTSACVLDFLATRGFVQKTADGAYARAE
jgi:hypothetical protein